jgi:xanthine dehydrogenase accessory factor
MDHPGIFQDAAAVLESDQNVALVTVVSVTGSTPGKVGYKMLVFDGGRKTIGTVGGGRIEAKMIEQAGRMLDRPGSQFFQFDLGNMADDEDGICGGSVEFLVETFDRMALPLFAELSAAVAGGEAGVLVSIISPDGLPRKIRLADAEHIETATDSGLSQEITTAIKEVAAAGNAGVRVTAGEMDVFIEPLAKPPTVILCGAGHLSYHIARYAKAVHFRVVVYDERPVYANRERFPDADEIIAADFERIFDQVQVDGDSYIVIVTRGHKCDEIVLERALVTNARYVGMIGSKRKTRTLLENLSRKNVSKEALDRVYSPVGISIGAVTPEEIALSIVCELVKVRRLGDSESIGHMTLSLRGGDA